MKGTCVVTLFLAVSLTAAPRYQELLQQAVAAEQSGDRALFLASVEAAVLLRPDSPRLLINLARTCAAQSRPDDALAALQRLADMNLNMNVAADPRLAPLQDLPRFQALSAQLAAGPAPAGQTEESTFGLSGVTGIIESCLHDPATGNWYFSDVRNRCIWQRNPDGSLARFSSDEDTLDGVFKLVLSPDRQTLWAATATVGVMTGGGAVDGKRSALVAIDFASGRVRARYPVPADGRPHLLGDFTFAPDGSLYATDSYSPVIWRLPAGGSSLEAWLESDEFLNLQGLAFRHEGKTLFVADYSNGIWRIDPAAKTPVLLTAPPHATFFGIDGLYDTPAGLLAIQNGVNPQRLLRIADAPVTTGITPAMTVLQGLPAMTDLALGQVVDGRFHFIGNSGWALFDPAPASAAAAREVTIYSVALE